MGTELKRPQLQQVFRFACHEFDIQNLFAPEDAPLEVCPECREMATFLEHTSGVVICDLCAAQTTWEEIDQASDGQDDDE